MSSEEGVDCAVVDPVVLDGEEALLSLWMMRGGGESGDKAVAPWFLQEDGAPRSIDAEQLGAVLREQLGITDMDPACSEQLLTRLIGAGGDSDPRVLSKEGLKVWMRGRFPAYQVRQMLKSVDFLTPIVTQLLGSAPQRDGLEHFRLLAKEDVRRALGASMNEWVDAIHSKISAFQNAVSGKQGRGGNLKFAGDLGSCGNTFEGKYESADAFDAGLDKFIGQPDPKVLDAIINEHCNSSNSTTPFTTSNYGLTCTPKEELEAALSPDPLKTYPGAGDGHGEREVLPFRVYLAATGCLDKAKWEDDDLQEVLLKIQDLCGGSLELTEQDRVREAQVLLMNALQGFAKTVKQVQLLVREQEKQGKPVSMDTFFAAVEAVRGWKRNTTERFIERGRELYSLAKLRPEEVLAVHLYTGPMFMHYNAVLRKFPVSVLTTMKGNNYVTTVHCINSAIMKLGGVSPMSPRLVYRGSNKMQLPLEFAAMDHLGRLSIVEMGFLSLTTAREMALQYAAGDALATVLKVERGDRSSGACIAALSYYYLEEEILFPPLSNLARVGPPLMDFAAGGIVVTEVPVRITINQHSETIDGLVHRRKFLHMGMLELSRAQVERELQPLALLLETICDSDADPESEVAGLKGTEAELVLFCDSAHNKCAQVYTKHYATPSAKYNDDEEFSVLVREGAVMKKEALNIDSHGRRKGQVLAKWFSRASKASVRGLEACVKVVGIKVFAGGDVVDEATARTPLFAASQAASFEICDALIKVKADVSAADVEGSTALLMACRAGSSDVFDALIKAKADVSAVDKQGSTALLMACRGGNLEIFHALIKAKADVSAVDKQGSTALLMACRGGNFEIFHALIKAKADVSAVDKQGSTALQMASEGGSFEICRALIKAGVNLLAADKRGSTALLIACQRGSFEICDALIKAKADVSAADVGGSTALLMACQRGSFEICDALIKAKADVSAVDKQGSTALLMACRGGSFEIFDALIKAGADTDVVRADGASLLSMSIMSGKMEVVALTLRALDMKLHASITSLAHLGEAYSKPSYIAARMSIKSSPLCLKTEISSLIATLGRIAAASGFTEVAALKCRLGHVRAFLENNSSMLQCHIQEAPVALRQAVTQLATQELDVSLQSGAAMLVADETDDHTGIVDGKDEAMRLIEWFKPQQTHHPCRVTFPASQEVCSVAYSPDGSSLARPEGRDVVLCCASSGLELVRGYGHSNSVLSVACSPDGEYVASGSRDYDVRIWIIKEGTCQGTFLKVLRGHSEHNPACTCNRQTHYGKREVWADPMCPLQGHRGGVSCLAWAPDGSMLASGDDGCEWIGGQDWPQSSQPGIVKLWSLRTGECLNTLESHTGSVMCVAWALSGSVLASGDSKGIIKLWTPWGICVQELCGHKAQVNSIAFAPDSLLLASCSGGNRQDRGTLNMDTSVRLWDLQSGAEVRKIDGHRSGNKDCTCEHRGGRDKDKAYEKDEPDEYCGNPDCPVQGHSCGVTCVQFNPMNVDQIVSGSLDSTVKVWSVSSGQCQQTFRHTGEVKCVAWAMDGTMLASGSVDKRERTWSEEKEGWVHSPPYPLPRRTRVTLWSVMTSNSISSRRAAATGAAEARTGPASATTAGQARTAAYPPALGSTATRAKRIPTQVGVTSNAISSRRAAATGAAEARTGPASATTAGQARTAAYPPALGSTATRAKRIPTQAGVTSNAISSRRAAATGAAEARTGPASATTAGQARTAAYPPALGSTATRAKRIPTQVGVTSNAISSRRAAATGAAEARTGPASATTAGQARTAAYPPALGSTATRAKRIPTQAGVTSNAILSAASKT
jgi:WD40 repeat protein/ankyrin repeat protein